MKATWVIAAAMAFVIAVAVAWISMTPKKEVGAMIPHGSSEVHFRISDRIEIFVAGFFFTFDIGGEWLPVVRPPLAHPRRARSPAPICHQRSGRGCV